MSYARFGWDGSDVYVFATMRDGKEVIECCACSLVEPEKLDVPFTDIFGITHEYAGSHFYADDQAGMISHLHDHELAGDTVVKETYDQLLSEIKDL